MKCEIKIAKAKENQKWYWRPCQQKTGLALWFKCCSQYLVILSWLHYRVVVVSVHRSDCTSLVLRLKFIYD